MSCVDPKLDAKINIDVVTVVVVLVIDEVVVLLTVVVVVETLVVVLLSVVVVLETGVAAHARSTTLPLPVGHGAFPAGT